MVVIEPVQVIGTEPLQVSFHLTLLDIAFAHYMQIPGAADDLTDCSSRQRIAVVDDVHVEIRVGLTRRLPEAPSSITPLFGGNRVRCRLMPYIVNTTTVTLSDIVVRV